MKPLMKKAVRVTWRSIVKPVIRLLPPSTSNRIETLLHYTKLTLVQGHSIRFRQTEVHSAAQRVVVHASNPGIEANRETSEAVQEGRSGILPDWAIEEMRELAHIEPSLHPRHELLTQFQRYHLPLQPAAGELYAECYPAVRQLRPDLIILAPWLKHGGADQGIIYHAEAAVAAGKSVLVITTLDAESPWSNRLPEGVGFLPFGQMSRNLSAVERLMVLARILLQSSARTIHLINAPLGWELVRSHGKSLRAIGKSIFASVFCDDYDSDGVRWSYADVYLPGCLPYIEGIFCDTQAYPRELARRFGADVSKLHTLYFPHALSARPRYRAGSGRSILWAARFSRQKRVDLLERIASLMPDVRFDVHGCGSSPEEQELAKRLARLGNVTVNGPFESLDQLVEDGKYSAFLYTSAWDGLPIVLLDATAAGLPIVASSVGGVGEFITEKTGVPVSCPDNAEDYVSGIRSVIDGPECGRALWENAVKLLNGRHAMEHFRSVITKVPGYL